MASNKIGENVQAEVKGQTLTLTIDLSKEVGPSKSAKSIIIGTTSGNHKLDGTDLVVGVNIYRPNKA